MVINYVMSSDGDWEGLYVDGVLVAENHSLDARTVIQTLGHSDNYKSVDSEWLNERGHLPTSFGELP